METKARRAVFQGSGIRSGTKGYDVHTCGFHETDHGYDRRARATGEVPLPDAFSRRGVRRGVRVRHDQGSVRGDGRGRGDINGRGGACYDRERDTGVPLINARLGLSLVIWKEGFANEETFEQSETVDGTALDASPSRSKSIRRQEGEEEERGEATHAGEGERRRTATRFGFRARTRTRRDFRRRRKVGTGRGGTREGAGGVRLK